MEVQQSYLAAFGSDSQKLKIGNLSFSCYLLENGRRVLLKNSIQKAFGYDGKSENWLFEFLIHINRLMAVEPVILEALGKDIVFQVKLGDGFIKKLGISPNLFVEACRTIVKANDEGFLYLSELRFAKIAETILKNIGTADIEKLIDHATGYELYKQNHKDALARHISKHGSYATWIRTFSDSFFLNLFAFKGWNWNDLNESKEITGAFLNDIIFTRIDDELFETLQTSKPKMQYRKKNIAEQYIEHPELKAHLQTIIALIRAADRSEIIFTQLLAKSHPTQRELSISAVHKKEAGDQAGVKFSVFNESMQKALQRKK